MNVYKFSRIYIHLYREFDEINLRCMTSIIIHVNMPNLNILP